MSTISEAPGTADRLTSAALVAFARRGYEATSLDEVAAEAGVRKQTLLYHHPSKEALLQAVIRRGVNDIADRLEIALGSPQRVTEAVVNELFRIGVEEPELLDLIREALRLGDPAATMLVQAATPLLDELSRRVPRDRVLGAVGIVVGMATEVEVARALGRKPSIADLRRRRRVLLDYLAPHRTTA